MTEVKMGKTVFLMVCLILLFMYVGDAIAGQEGMITAFWMACGMNVISYFFSDTLVLKQYRAKEVNNQNEPELYQIVARLAAAAQLPMPKVYIIPEQVPNAFATGRNPKHAAVAATQGLLELMSPQELEGVLAHEMSHVRHYDILIGSVAAIFAGAIAMLGRSVRNPSTSDSSAGTSRIGVLGIILVPLAATVIQMAISRTREYKADEGSAYLTGHPEWLISALSKLDGYAKNYQIQRASRQTAHLFIVNPFSGVSGLSNLFSTHPSTADRIAQLEKIGRSLS
ncbi:MAG: zinc metalloprotease HtpX [Alphaproteobacteria bacterium]|nr:zinc metalloprotease HtpX [Alphaproteobacteria bacterium]